MKTNARQLHDALLERAKPVVLFKGDCKGCGECCSRFLPLSKFDIDRIERYIEENGIKMRPTPPEVDIDMFCPYLTDERTCSIYDARPDICRIYRCDVHAAGCLSVGLMGHHPYELLDLREVMRDE